MTYDPNEVKFGGEVIVLAEKEFGASPEEATIDSLYQDWKSNGEQVDRKKWIRASLSKRYICAAEKPKWPRDPQAWPEHDGKPMVFLGQIHVPKFAYSGGHETLGTIIFIFGAPEGTPDRWKSIIKTIELPDSFKGAKITKVIKDLDKF